MNGAATGSGASRTGAAGKVQPVLAPEHVPYLARLSDADRAALVSAGPELRYPARTAVLTKGEPTSHVLVIRDGWLKVTDDSNTGYESLLALRGPGDVIGESAALHGASRSASVMTLKPVTAVVVPARDFNAFLDARPGAARLLMSVLADRVRAGDHKRLELSACSVKERLARLLLELAEHHGEPVPSGVRIRVPLTQQELAGAVGSSRESVTRLLRELRERGCVATQRHGVVVTRPEVLRRIGGSA
ncbi:Crp/Fnr family transcriptional regulator [Streptomyces albidoflavus]